MRRRNRSIPNPPLAPRSALEGETETDRAPIAAFGEWPLGNAVLKRVTMEGLQPTFVVQFTWDPCAQHGTGYPGTENRSSVSLAKRHRPANQRGTRYEKSKDTIANAKPTSTSRRPRYTPEDDTKICQLKKQGLSWFAITKRFLGRTPGAIEARYRAKLKTTNPSRAGARRLCDSARTPSVVDNASEQEWGLEEICDCRELDDGSVELRVKWKGGEETWEPTYLERDFDARSCLWSCCVFLPT